LSFATGKELVVAGGCPDSTESEVKACDEETFCWTYDDGALFCIENKDLVLEAYEIEDAISLARVRIAERTGDAAGQRWRILAQYEDEDEQFRPSFALGKHKMDGSFNDTKQKVKQHHTSDEVGDDRDFGCDVKDIEWVRPDEIVKNPKFIKDGVSRFDINQRQFGNCWAISVMANLAYIHKQHPEILDQVFDSAQSFEDGNHTFTFRFFREGDWDEITVDDYLPKEPNTGKLMCVCSTDKEEFWPSLMMKAYAKFKGSYADIEGGWMSVALNDMTGDSWKEEWEFTDMYKETCEFISSHGLVLAGTRSGDKLGIVSGHAYSVTGFGGDVTNGKCIRVRNPWGKTEYIGSEADILNDKEDGEFVLKWETFCEHFMCLTVKA
jgi:hypothetical protein